LAGFRSAARAQRGLEAEAAHDSITPVPAPNGLPRSTLRRMAHDDQQLVAMINKQIEPEFGVRTTTSTTTSTSTSTTTEPGKLSTEIVQPLRQDLLFIPEGIGAVSDDVIGGAPPMVPALFGIHNNSQSATRETNRRIHMMNAQIRQRNMSQNYRPPVG
jgi:hypothetical protein